MCAYPQHTCRVIAYQPWGITSRAPFSRNLTSAEAWRTAGKRDGGLKNLTTLSGDNDDELGAIILSYTPYFDGGSASGNSVGAWTGDTSYLRVLSDPYGFGAALKAELSRPPTTPFQINGTSNWILKNTPFSVALTIYNVPELAAISGSTDKQRLIIQWADYIFIIWGGQARIMRINELPNVLPPGKTPDDYYNDSAFAAWIAEEIKDSPTQSTIDDLRAQLFFDYHELSQLGSFLPEGDKGATRTTLTFIPEPRGQLTIERDGGGTGSDIRGVTVKNTKVVNAYRAAHSSALASATPYAAPPVPLWPDCAPIMQCNAGAFFFQWGYPKFSKNGSFTGETLEMSAYNFSNALTASGMWSSDTVTVGSTISSTVATHVADPTLTGTNIRFLATTPTPVPTGYTTPRQLQFRLDASSDQRLTPFLYSLQFFGAAGVRTGFPRGTAIWDSNDHTDAGGNPIIDVELIWQDEGNSLVRRRGADITIRDVNGALATTSSGYDYLEGCMCDVYIDGTKVLGNGVIERPTVEAVSTPTGTPMQWTRLRMCVSDMWAIAESNQIFVQPIGDGMYLNDYLRLMLTNMGCDSTEISGINSGASSMVRLPRAALGEAPAVQPEQGMSYADWFRTLLEKFGLHITVQGSYHKLQAFSGIWDAFKVLENPALPNTTDPVTGGKFIFDALAANNSVGTYAVADPPVGGSRYAILTEYDLEVDETDFYNFFRVEGAPDVNGNPQSADRALYHSWNAAHKGRRDYLGRVKRYPHVKDDSLRSIQDINNVIDSLVRMYGRSLWYGSFDTYLHIGLKPGHIIQLGRTGSPGGGRKGIVTRISGCSALNDRMCVTYMQIHGGGATGKER